MRGNLNAMTQRTSLVLVVATILAVGACQSPQSRIAIEPSVSQPRPVNCAPMLVQPDIVAKYPQNAEAGFNSPEEVTAFLEKRWPLAKHSKIRNSCATPQWPGFPKIWGGRLYCDKSAGFDSIEWYATIEIRHTKHLLKEFSLGAIRGKDFWLLEGGNPTSVQQPPNVEPDFRKPYFVGHK